MEAGDPPPFEVGNAEESWVILGDADNGRLSPVSIASDQHNTQVVENFEALEFQRFRNNVAPNLHLHLHNNFFSAYQPKPQSFSLTPALALFPGAMNSFTPFPMSSSTSVQSEFINKPKFVDIDLKSQDGEKMPSLEKLDSFRSNVTETGKRMVEAENLNSLFFNEKKLEVELEDNKNSENIVNNKDNKNTNVSSNSSISSLDDNEEVFHKLFTQIQQNSENETGKKYNGRSSPVLKSQSFIQSKEMENIENSEETEEFIKLLQKRKLERLQKQKNRKVNKSVRVKKKTSFNTKKQSSVVELIFRINEFFSGNLFSHVFALILGVYIGHKYISTKKK